MLSLYKSLTNAFKVLEIVLDLVVKSIHHCMYHIPSVFISVSLICSNRDELRDNGVFQKKKTLVLI